MATLKPAKTQTASLTQCWEFLWKQGGQKCKLKMIDVVLFGEDGTPLRWLFTSKEGLIKRKSSASLKLPNVYKRFIHLGSDDPKNSKSIAAVAYLSDGEQVPVTGATLAEILLSGPRIGSLKRGGAIVALRGYSGEICGSLDDFISVVRPRAADRGQQRLYHRECLLIRTLLLQRI